MLLKKFRQAIADHALLTPGETVVVGVSGGPDSLCLLHLLCRLSSEFDLKLHVGHLNHGLRGPDADEEAEFVRNVASDWNLPCTVEFRDVPALARAHGLAFEEAARQARYAFLGAVARAVGSRTVAVGHTADDQAETVLMHWIRGSGLAGLRGMLPATELGDYRLLDQAPFSEPRTDSVRLIRPLLEVSRAEIMAYCAYHRLEPRFDRSNLDTTYFRNWLRHEVIPILARHNPNIQEVMRRSARVIADEYSLLRRMLDETWPSVVLEETAERIVFGLAPWRTLPIGLQRSTLREAVHRLRLSLRNIGFVHIEDAVRLAREGATGKQATLPQGLMLTVGYDRLTVAEADMPAELPDWPLLPASSGPIRLLVPGLTLLPGGEWMLEARVVARAELPPSPEAHPDPWAALLDPERLVPPLELRTRRQGDRFHPEGMAGHTVKLADFLTNHKVPRGVRDRLPLLVDSAGIAWVCGIRLDQRARLSKESTQALALQFVRA